MPTDKVVPGQMAVKVQVVIDPDDARLLEELSLFAERSGYEAARSALMFMGAVLREAKRRTEQTG